MSYHLHAEVAFMPGKPQPGTVDGHKCCAYKLLDRLLVHTQIGVKVLGGVQC